MVYYTVCSPLTHHYGPKRPTTGSAVLQLTMKRDDFLNVGEEGTCQFNHDIYVPIQHGAVEQQIQDLQVAQVGPLRVEQLCTTQHTGFRHTSGGPSPCGTALYNTTHRLQTHFRWALSVWNSSVQHNTQASDTLQVGPLRVEQLCTTQHTLQTQLTHFRWPLSVWNSSVQHNMWLQTQLTHFRWPLSVWNNSVQHNTRFRHSRHTSGGPSLCGTALYNTTHASDTVDTLQVAPLCVEQLCTTQHTLQTQSTRFRHS